MFRPLIKCIHHYYIQNKVNKPYNFCLLRQGELINFKNTYWTLKIYPFVPPKGGTAVWKQILRLSDDLITNFSEVVGHISCGICYLVMLRQCKIFLQNLVCMSFCNSFRNAIFTTKFKGFNCLHVFFNFCEIWYLLFFIFLSRMGRSVVPRVKYNNLLHAKDRFSGFRRRVGMWGPPWKLQNSISYH